MVMTASRAITTRPRFAESRTTGDCEAVAKIAHHNSVICYPGGQVPAIRMYGAAAPFPF